MANLPSPKFVELEDEYYHVRFRDPDEFSEIRTPDWATAAAEDVTPGSKVRTGKRTGSDDWVVQSVLVPKAAGKSGARSKAKTVLEKIESSARFIPVATVRPSAMTDDTRRASTPTVDAPVTDGGRSPNEWVDLHLTDPAPDSWEVDVQVERGAVETVLLRLHADGLPGVVNSLLADADDELVHRVLAYVVDRQGVDPATLAPDE